MRFIPKRPSIEEEGLEVYLDRTAEEHKGHGYEHFVEMLTDEKKYTKPQIAIEFGVDRSTIYNWLEIYNKELVK
ncbi:MAG TPA: helix-turn-helix domain-containing protein [Candidatus Saccharimonadales bacterium]|jgi:hypothetical protein|nr:helix-turn-helix domain-containing protein [Candidatus Saccharimonadales bacterium]